MVEPGEASSSVPPPSLHLVNGKPVVVRVKRQRSQARVDAFWLEINERPLKKRLLDFGSLSISDSTGKGVLQESRPKKLLVQHVETISHSEAIKDVLQSFLPHSTGSNDLKKKIEERRNKLKHDKKQDQLLSAARQKHEDLARSARFEQIWKRRRGNKEADDYSLRGLCHLYDVVRVDKEDEKPEKVQEPEDHVEDNAILCNYLPLIREFLPTVAEQIESEMKAYLSKEDNYVYDLYTVEDSLNSNVEDTSSAYPLVQVNDDDDDDYYDGPLQSEFESDDSNAEDNPGNDYPDEESIEDDESENEDAFNDLEGSDSQHEEETVGVDEGEEENWKWEYRQSL